MVFRAVCWLVIAGSSALLLRSEWRRSARSDWITPRSAGEAACLLVTAYGFVVLLALAWLFNETSATGTRSVVFTVASLGTMVALAASLMLAWIVWRRRPPDVHEPRLFPTMMMPSRLADAGSVVRLGRNTVLGSLAGVIFLACVIGLVQSIRLAP